MSTQPTCDPNTGIWKAMIFCSFLMLSVLTWAAGPIQKVFEKVQHKETVKAKMLLCSEIRAGLPVYEDWTRRLFINGCLWLGRSVMVELNADKADAIRQQWKDEQGKEFDMINNECIAAAAAQQEQNNMRDRVLSPLYHEKLNCPAVYDEAEKLGLKEEDVQQ